MSQYRDHYDAARLRIVALEARLAERDAELEARGTELAARDEEIARLQRELARSPSSMPSGGSRYSRSMDAAWASRIVGVATGLALMAAGTGVTLVRSSVSASTAPAVRVLPVEAADGVFPVIADPVAVTEPDWDPTNAEREAKSGRETLDELETRRLLEAKVWGGHATKDEIRALKAICTHQLDHTCRDRARVELERARRRAASDAP